MKPRQVPQARNDLMAAWSRLAASRAPTIATLGAPSIELDILSTARLYWVASDLVALAQQAARSLPPDTCLAPHAIPASSGLILFESPIAANYFDGGRWGERSMLLGGYEWSIVCVSTRNDSAAPWHVCLMKKADDEPMSEWPSLEPGSPWTLTVFVRPYAWQNGRLMPCSGGEYWPVDTPIGGALGLSPVDEMEQLSREEDHRAFVSLMSLIASPGVTDQANVWPDRATQRRMARDQSPDITNGVRVIYLRGARPTAPNDSVHGDVTYHHRWIVSGHWRNQAYGKGRQLRRPVWISPHVKGPADAPLLEREVVWAVVP